MDYTSRLKLPRYADADAADLTKGYNVAADRLEAVIGPGLMTYPPHGRQAGRAAGRGQDPVPHLRPGQG